MKYLALTFDDGRDDNYTYAYPIMKKYNLKGTLYCTTGYIDGTWTKPSSWKSADKPLTIDQLLELKYEKWELGLHGDKHTTESNDFSISLMKMDLWGLADHPIGFSMPNSNMPKKQLDKLIETHYDKRLSYIRVGRKTDTKRIFPRFLFACYTFLHLQTAYNLFNKDNIIHIDKINLKEIYSVVIRYKDSPQMVKRFLRKMPDNTCAVLMFHSILPEDHPLYGADPWNWSIKRFDSLCSQLYAMEKKGIIKVKPLAQIVQKNGKKHE